MWLPKHTMYSIPTRIQFNLAAGFRLIIFTTKMFVTDEAAEPCIIFDGTRKSQLAVWFFFHVYNSVTCACSIYY